MRCRPGDNLLIHKALTMARPGDVIVVDAGGDLTNALFGEIMVATAVARGVAGVVLNGAMRDSEEIGAGEFPLYAAGVTHRGPYKDGPGEINLPIAIDGMVIHPGDLMLGDADGLLCVPFDEAQALLAATHKKMAAEKQMLADIQSGEYAKSFILENRAGAPTLLSRRRLMAEHSIEVVGEKLRAMMPWIKANKLVDKSRN